MVVFKIDEGIYYTLIILVSTSGFSSIGNFVVVLEIHEWIVLLR